jgi:hypothetical protein
VNPVYRSLDPDKIITTLDKLQRRIAERFPDSGLHRLGLELHTIASEARQRARSIEKPILWLRVGASVLVLLIVATFIGALTRVQMPAGEIRFFEFVSAVDAGVNDVVFIGIAIFFLVTFEVRIKRKRALGALHELRAIAHVIDMHQLVKDPAAMHERAIVTSSSPPRSLTPYELKRYLDYCSELLSLTGKIAAVYVQSFSDPVALNAVNEIENLTTGLSRKIWQKIMILSREAA